MRHRCCRLVAVLAILIAVVSLAPTPVAGQTASAAAAWTPPRTSDGQPDLQGVWANVTSTPLERPAEFKGKAELNNEEWAKYTKRQQAARENRDRRDQKPGSVTDVGRAYNALWFPVPGEALKRTSLIVDPPEGQLPALTPEAMKRFTSFQEARGKFASAATVRGRGDDVEDGTEGGVDGRGSRADNPEDRTLGERCLTSGLPRLPGAYNNHIQIVQTRDYVVIELEMHRDVRIIPLGGRPGIPPNVRQWHGDSRGRWEGNTLVVETSNFNDRSPFMGSFDRRRLVERFTRVDANTINYEFTNTDPTTWTRPWTASFPLTSLQSAVGGIDGINTPRIFEYACHEGNYGLAGQLSGARADQKAAAKIGSR